MLNPLPRLPCDGLESWKVSLGIAGKDTAAFLWDIGYMQQSDNSDAFVVCHYRLCSDNAQASAYDDVPDSVLRSATHVTLPHSPFNDPSAHTTSLNV